MERVLESHWSLCNLKSIVKEHVRLSRSINSLRKGELARIVAEYLCLLILKDELDEYDRMVRVLNEIPRKGYQPHLNYFQKWDFLKSGEGLVQLTQALFGNVVEWPLVRPIFVKAPVSPLVCVDLLPPGSYVQIDFKIPTSRPTDPKRRFFLMYYRLQRKPPQYEEFLRRNAAVIPQLLKSSQDQRIRALAISQEESMSIIQKAQTYDYF